MQPNDPENELSRYGILGYPFKRYGPVRVFSSLIALYVFFVITYHAGILIPILKWAGIIVLCLASLFGIGTLSIVWAAILFFNYLEYLRELDQQSEQGDTPE